MTLSEAALWIQGQCLDSACEVVIRDSHIKGPQKYVDLHCVESFKPSDTESKASSSSSSTSKAGVRSRSKRTCHCTLHFRVVIPSNSPDQVPILKKYNCHHRGHFPRKHPKNPFSKEDGEEIHDLRVKHGMSTGALLAYFRSKGKLATTKQMFNALNSYVSSTQYSPVQSDQLLHTMCTDPDMIFAVRFSILDSKATPLGVLDLLRVPGYKYMIPLVAGQQYFNCRGLAPNSDLDLVPRKYTSVFER